MRIDKITVLAAQLNRPLIHHIRKIFNGTAHMDGQGISRIVGRGQHHGIQAVLYRQLLILIQGNMGALILHINRFVGNLHQFIQFTVFHGEKGCHDFRNAGRVILGVHVLAVQDGSGGNLHHYARFRNHRRS